MPRISLRVPDHVLADWQRHATAHGLTLSAFIRERPDLTPPTDDLDDIRRRLTRLEQLAHLD